MEGSEEGVSAVASTRQQQEEIKKCYHYFYEQLIARGLGPDEQGYRLLMSITRRVVLYPNENDQSILNGNLEEFVWGLSNAPVESQKDLLKILLGLLPPHYQSQVINFILSYENRDRPDTFARDDSFGGQLAMAVTEMEGNYQPYLDELTELQKLVERHLDEFKKELKADTLEKLIQCMNGMLETMTTSVDVVPPLIKSVCKNIAQVSPTEDVGFHRIAGFFINRYLGGVISKRNEALFSKTGTGELVSTSIRKYMLKFLQSLATTTEPEKLAHLRSPFVETVTNENREKLAVFLKMLCQGNLEKEEPTKLNINCDWEKLSRMECDFEFRARYYTIYSSFHQVKTAQSQSPRISRPVNKGALRGKHGSLLPKRSSSPDMNLIFNNQFGTNPTDPIKGLLIIELMNEIFTDTNHYHDAYGLCADFIFYHLEKLCRQPTSTAEDAQRKSLWSPRASFHDVPDNQENRQIILSNVGSYLTYIKHIGQIQLGITYLLFQMSRVDTKESNGAIYERLYGSLIEVAFIRGKETVTKTFEDLVNCMNRWIKRHPERQKDVDAKATLLGELLISKDLTTEAFKSLFLQKIELSVYGGASSTLKF